ncbi:hypothetical protein ACH42_14770 [Endozoicomonas sp. (ex Bugula neritina AB1)]|nr:hypothetical protein ACH42_14770 [Endozoicomonas sp. (ex Bugula neritina AB1)]
MKFQSRMSAFWGVLVFCLMQWSSTVSALESPKVDVEKTTKGLLETFEKNVGSYQENPDAFVQEVSKELTPVVAFEAIARGVMGKYTRRSEPEQIVQFSQVFKDSLLSFYGKALLKLDNTYLSIDKIDDVSKKTLEDYEAGKARLVPVDMVIKTSTRTVAISYSMVHVDGRWKMRNIIVDGINIGKQFRNQFAEAVDTHGDIQYVIDHWLDIMSGKDQIDKNGSANKI